jgi:hypothetical protein
MKTPRRPSPASSGRAKRRQSVPSVVHEKPNMRNIETATDPKVKAATPGFVRGARVQK